MIININKRNVEENNIEKSYDEYCKRRESVVFLSKLVIENHVTEPSLIKNKRFNETNNLYNCQKNNNPSTIHKKIIKVKNKFKKKVEI